ncbi:MAG: hypothetical protein IKO27_01940 [Ruminococcus sp.]|nr:hypothetical protein [Ruminococcus sp.]
MISFKLRAFAAVLALAACVMMFTGCAGKAEDVKLLTEDQAKEYVSKNYPAAEYSGKETLSDGVKFRFRDELCGFEFSVVSSTEKKYFDATVVGYGENTSDNWKDSYCGYLKKAASSKADEIAKANGLRLMWNNDLSHILYIGTDKSVSDLGPVLKELGAVLKAEDKHHKLDKATLYCYNGAMPGESDKAEIFAVYYFETDETVDAETFFARSKDSSNV